MTSFTPALPSFRRILTNLLPVLAFGIGTIHTTIVFGQNAGTITGTVSVRGMRDAKGSVVYIEKIPGSEFLPDTVNAVMDQLNLTFVPYVLPILKGTSVDFPNNDSVRHNVFTPSEVGNEFHLGVYPKGVVKTVTFDKPGAVILLCNVHAEMSAYIFVTETPYAAAAEVERGQRSGTYTIDNVPPGKYVLKIWHRRAEDAEQVVELLPGATLTADFSIRRK